MSDTLVIDAVPLTRAAFAPFGDVIDSAGHASGEMNDGTLARYDALARVELDDAQTSAALISLARCRRALHWPVAVTFVERHPLGSQAFIPLSAAPVGVVVAPPGDAPQPHDLSAFISNGRQGINYHRGVWHVPLIVLEVDQEVLIVERSGPGANCDLHYFDAPVVIAPGATAQRS